MQIVYLTGAVIVALFAAYSVRVGVQGIRYNKAHPENTDPVDNRVAKGFIWLAAIFGASFIMLLIAGLWS